MEVITVRADQDAAVSFVGVEQSRNLESLYANGCSARGVMLAF